MNTFAAAREQGLLTTNPQTLADDLDYFVQRLDELEKGIEHATDVLNDCEDAWLVLFDEVAESLRDEYVQAGRKADPAEHTIESVARRESRSTYSNYRRAKRAVEMLDKQIRAVTAALSGKQSRSRVAGAEAAAGVAPPEWARRGAT